MPYGYVETKYPQWVRQLPSLRVVARIEERLLMKRGTGSTQTSSYVNVYWIPFFVEDVLTLLDYEEKAYAKLRRADKVIAFAKRYGPVGPTSPFALPPPQNAVLLTLPRADLEEQYIIPAIEASRVEGPEPLKWWAP